MMPMPRNQDMERFCAHCRRRLERKRINGRLEDRTVFLKRRYCNRNCMAQAYLQEDANLAALRKRAEKFRVGECQQCNTKEKLQIHHLDGNPANNSPKNLMTLCSSCHMKWHWIHGKKSWKRQSVCKICGEPARKLDMCQKHYQRYRKYGDPCLTKKKHGSAYVLVRELPGVESGRACPESPWA